MGEALGDLKKRARRLKERVSAGDIQPQVLLELADVMEELPRAWCRVMEERVEQLAKRVTTGDFTPSILRALADAQEELTRRQSAAAHEAVEIIMSSPA